MFFLLRVSSWERISAPLFYAERLFFSTIFQYQFSPRSDLKYSIDSFVCQLIVPEIFLTISPFGLNIKLSGSLSTGIQKNRLNTLNRSVVRINIEK